MKFPKKKYSEINKFYLNYIDNLNICLRNMNLSKLKKISKMIEDTVKNKKKNFYMWKWWFSCNCKSLCC